MLHTHKKNNLTQLDLIQINIPLANKNWFKTGGNARYFCTPKNSTELTIATEYAYEHNLKTFILGTGANILISDDGFDGLVIRPAMSEKSIISQNEDISLATIGTGIALHDAIEWCLQNNLSGLEEFSGIPSTIGGAVYINLHYYEFLLEHFLHSATVFNLQTYKIETVTPEWFNFGYNQSKLHEKKHLLVDATFAFKKITNQEVAYARGRSAEIIRHRERRYPQKNTCGSFFRNFTEDEVPKINGKKIPYVAYYLDKVGVKGSLQIGGAVVSHQHANMIVNKKNATTSDIIAVARTMQELVKKEFGIIPQPECQLVGFKTYPLLKQPT